MKKQKNQNGITLIALVVTIIVLLILAGVTITFVLSDTSVFTKGKQAADDTILRSLEEYAGQLATKEAVAYYAGDGDLTSENGLASTALANFFPGYDVEKSPSASASSGKLTGHVHVKGPDGTIYRVDFGNDGVPVAAKASDTTEPSFGAE